MRNRTWVGRIFGAALAFALFAGGTALGAAKSVILLIGDGMGPEQVKAASIKLKGADGKLAMQGLPARGTLTNKPADADVTDSAAAATALATGHKTNNGMISMTPDGKKVRTILEACKAAGKGTGLVATSSITHATPACFAAHVSSRGSEHDIADQMVRAKLDVALGGGRDFFGLRRGQAYVEIDLQNEKGDKLVELGDRVNWTQPIDMMHVFSVPAGATKGNVWVWCGGGLDVYVDDFFLREKRGKNDEGPNLLVNPDFEKDGLAGWNQWSACQAVKDGGSMALRVGADGGLDQAVPLEAGKSYTFGYRAHMADFYGGKKPVTALDYAKKAGVKVVESREQLARVKSGRVLGLFKPAALETKDDEPTLAEMTGKALDLLGKKEKGFFLMVEGSQIDWANHGNDEKEFYRQMESFDAAVAKAMEFAAKRKNVLVIVCADHETGGMKVEGADEATLKVTYSTEDHTATNVPIFASGPGAEAFAGEHDNTDVPKLIAKELKVKL